MNSRSVTPSYRLLLAVACVLAVLGAAPVDAQSLAPLLAAAPPSAAALRADAAGRREVMRTRRVTVDVTRLAEGTAADADLRARGTLLLNLFDDATFVATLDRIERVETGYNWIGRLAGIDGGQAVLSVVGDVVAATIFTSNDVYAIRYAGDGVHEAQQIDQSKFPREANPIRPPQARTTASADATVAAADAGTVVDLLVVYTPAAVSAAQGNGVPLTAVINNAVSVANTAYSNSGINFRLRLVHAEQVSLTEGTMGTDLSALRSGTGALAGVPTLRNTYGADVVSLIGDYSTSDPNYCGMGYLMSSVGSSFASWAFTVIEQSCAASNLSLAHELGHNMGANHDWYVDNSVVPQTYAHGYANTSLRWRTIMAYNDVCVAAGVGSCTRIPHFSNPAVTWGSAATGIPGGTRSNCVSGNVNDTACDADNHRTLNESAGTVAAFRTAVSPVATPIALRFAGTKTGVTGNMVAVTPGQAITVATSNSSATWTATADQPWVRLTDVTGAGAATGTGTGRFIVSIASPNNVLGVTNATVTITPGTAGQVPATVSVSLTATLVSTGTAVPFGQVDTPAQSATGIVGAVGVTGWALDDVGVNKVRIYRNCLSFEDTPTGSPCATLAGYRMVYIGDAAFLAGARPDVESAFPGYPQGYRAGWGYLMLTNMLPHVTRSVGFGGQGPITLYAIATDEEGQATLLGRSRLDHVPTTVTLDNDNIAKPFGAMDTPGQGETVSGVKPNFGWVLTPDRSSTGIVMPTNGSTMHVYIDGVSVAQVTYNQCRGTVGNPVPSLSYCNDDVANIFGTTSPQPTGTTRTTNPSIYRNLDAGRGAIGSYDIDTRTMANGIHTIAWGVVDSASRTEGIGSRFFTVLNAASGDTGAAGVAAIAAEVAKAPAVPRADARILDGLVASPAQVLARVGFDPQALPEPLTAGPDGVRHVQLAALGRLELQLGQVDAGYLEANGTLRDLPPGSHLDTSSGFFTWAPGVGYHGVYRLVFLSQGAKTTVAVGIRPEVRAHEGESEIRMFLDFPAASSTVDSAWTVAGWAFDPQAAVSSGIGAVHVWAQRRDTAGAAPVFLGSAELNVPRPDVASAFGEQFASAGFHLTVRGLPPGRYDVTAYVWNRRTARWEDARTTSISIR